MNRLLFTVAAATLLLLVSQLTGSDKDKLDLSKLPPAAAGAVDFARDIEPILTKNCLSCHNETKHKGGLRLDEGAEAAKGGNTGAAFVPGDSKNSRLIHTVAGLDPELKMPPGRGKELTPVEIGKLRAWIDQGAKFPAGKLAGGKVEEKKHWAFQPVQRPALPEVQAAAWPRNGIDRFILARLEKDKISPSPEADRATLVRRVSLDLTGLPPTPEEMERALTDSANDWYEKVVDRLLASPHYGERMGRHWLDLARYADSHGYTIDAARSIWMYRDWVIDAFNRDLPFDRFTIEQLAGDLLPNATQAQKVATGFHRNTQINQEGGIDQEQFRVEAVVDRVNTTGQVWLGVTMGCCQCHDHKFDPFSQREYFQMFAFFNNADEPTLEMPTPEQQAARTRLKNAVAGVEKGLRVLDIAPANKERAWEEKLTAQDRLGLPDEIVRTLALALGSRDNKQKQALTAFYLRANHLPHAVGGLGDALPFMALAHLNASVGRSKLDQYRAELRKTETEVVTTMVMQERKAPRVTNVMIQGDFTRKGVVVDVGTPRVLQAQGQPPLGLKTTRLDLAKWLVDPTNPLTPRVTVNRFWQHFFGLGIVETENDFGTQGTPPSHPELLDWLAGEFVARQWSVKSLHKLIVMSATYRQSSRHRPELAVVDARNRLLARQNRVRLEAEGVRDMALASTGLLTRKVGGPSVFPPQPDGVYKFTQLNKDWRVSTGADRYRRGMYTFFWRSAPHPGLTVFDAPDGTNACTRRNRSNTPLQALTLLNDSAYIEFAEALAKRVLREAKPDAAARIRHAYQLALSRPPSPKEEERLTAFLAQQRTSAMSDEAAWTMLSRALLNLDEFITRE